MKFKFYPETDSLYIELSSNPSVESNEVSEGIVLDYDTSGKIVGIDIDNASSKIDIQKITMSNIPLKIIE